jgi:hypothetical protein
MSDQFVTQEVKNNRNTIPQELPEFYNAVDFFVLLLKIDQRVNPHLYKQDNNQI